MIQPKRGCYGAKCTGEVCKVLQDPSCPPTHQFLASYFYAEQIFGADAWIHFGTHGCLEYLPGKANGLSAACYPDIAVGEKPNFYVFNAASIASAMLAKRRTYAVIIDHKPLKEGMHILERTEIESLLRGLGGGFILPGEGGTEEDNPAVGRNLYGVQLDRIPTKEAYSRGTQAAEDMVARYLAEEERYPEQIVLNMISLDIPRTGGEQFALFLRLLGVRPVWNERGVVTDIELIQGVVAVNRSCAGYGLRHGFGIIAAVGHTFLQQPCFCHTTGHAKVSAVFGTNLRPNFSIQVAPAKVFLIMA